MKKNLKPVNKQKNPGLAKLPTAVRNKMGFMKKGGVVKGMKIKTTKTQFEKDMQKRKDEMNREAKKRIRQFAKGGSVSRGQYDAQVKKIKFKGVF